MPIGAFAAIFAFLILTTFASGYWLLLRANAIAREADTPDNEIVPGRTRPPSRRTSRTGLWTAAALFGASCIGLGTFLALYVSGAIASDWTANDPTVQRP
ncbi:hypothetical protein RZN05_03370 [Sphingomonas sp. HF-S4]|uniref:Uncharacterized protein n=1 Tax=Sphingomonas agrestis TaxID=3080540 RepID=A0ABU3Y462_9SPHN|nr:hypothetical protein [Sphingomonas sp. HF-S4]MDV3456008.1 hypothetical protein [Sphingomonas sp. HF-S4]